MGFYGFDNESDFNEYRLLKENEESGDYRPSSSSRSDDRSNDSSRHSSSNYGYRSTSNKALPPEEEKRQQEMQDMAEWEKRKKEMKEKRLNRRLNLVRVVVILALAAGIAAGSYWQDIRHFIEGYLPSSTNDYEYYVGLDEETDTEDVVDKLVDSTTATGPTKAASVSVPVTSKKNNWHSSSYSSSHWDDPDPDEYDDEDDDDTWYRGEDDPDMYYEYDYHE